MKRTAKDEQRKREMIGVALFAFAVFIAVSVYTDATGLVGKWIGGFIFGLFGIFAYISPLFVAFSGVLLIASGGKHVHAGKVSLVAGILLLLGAFTHLFVFDALSERTFVGYVWGSFQFGESARAGGGLFGGLISYPAALLIGQTGSVILFGTGMLICLLVLTNISLKKTGEQIGEKVKETRQSVMTRRKEKQEQRALYLEAIQKAKAKEPGSVLKSSEAGVDVLPSSGPIKKRQRSSSYPFDLFAEDEPEALYETPDIDELPIGEPSEYEPEAFQEEPPWNPDVLPFAPRRPREVAAEPEFFAPKRPEQREMSAVLSAPEEYKRPPITLLHQAARTGKKLEDPRETAQLLLDTLASFGIAATVTDITVGPIITRFELQPALGVRVNRITNLSDDIALRLAAHRVRIEAPIPGKAAIGIEIPNKEKASVLLRDVIESKEFQSGESKLTVALGKDIAGKVQVADLSKMPHLLIAGQTGSGKSVCINDIIISLVYKATPDEVRMILIDPKVVEFQVYETLPHLLVPVVTDPSKAAGALKWAVQEMVRRYQEFAKLGARDLARYNELMLANGEKSTSQIVIIIDELADLMMVAPDDVEDGICRLAQIGRAAGLHLVVATQRPSADVITGLIKANIPSRVALAVASATDSRIVLDQGGAEKLLGRGDMLFHPSGTSKPVRAQCAWVSDQEAEAIREYFQQHSMRAEFDSAVTNSIISGAAGGSEEGQGVQYEDELLPRAAEIAIDGGSVSTSMLQRRLRVGYSRAGRLVDIMEDMGIVGPAEGSKPRKVLITRLHYEQMFGPGDIPASAYDDGIES